MGVVLRGFLEDSIPDPRPPAAMGPEGRFAVTALDGDGISIWSADGRYLETVGRGGEGPGEFGASPLPLFDDAGNLHVFDPTRGSWDRFGRQGHLETSIRSEHLAQVYWPGRIAMIGPDSVLLGAPSPSAVTPRQFRILSSDGESSGFGDTDRSQPIMYQARPIALTDRGTFWVGPRQGSDEYVIQEWSLDGSLLRSLHREPPWDPLDPPPANRPDPNPMPRFPMLATGPGGELIVMAVVSVPDDLDAGGTIEVWYEVLDADRSEVLASEQTVLEGTALERQPPTFGLARHSPLGFRQITVEPGLPAIEILAYDLEPRDESSVAVCRQEPGS